MILAECGSNSTEDKTVSDRELWVEDVSTGTYYFQGNAESLPRLITIAMIITGMVLINVIRNTAGMRDGVSKFPVTNSFVQIFQSN